MSYQVLARKWRPKDFTALVGQEHVVRALTHALDAGRLHHAYLFTGTRGVGKTTIARILAKSLNCETGISAQPCNVCTACAEIDSGRFVDLIEVDAATNTRVDEMRQLLENAVYAPTRGRYKVYVIDEVHMLSNSAFNAMLKTLEEPPGHIKFILATTDPQKIPVTVLSRCLQFNLKQIAPPMIAAHLAAILAAENIAFEQPALYLLAHAANGSMRDALSLLDQAIAHGGGALAAGAVGEMLGSVSNDYLLQLLDALSANDIPAMLALADHMMQRSLAFDVALKALASLLTHLQIAQLAPTALADDLPEKTHLSALADRFAPDFVQLAYQIVVHGYKDLPLAPDPYTGFVMTLLRLAAFAPETVSAKQQDLVGRSSLSSALTSETKRPVEIRVAPKTILPFSPESNADRDTVPPVAVSHIEKNAPAQPQELSLFPDPIPVTEDLDWQTALSRMPLKGMTRELAFHCMLSRCEHDKVLLRLSPEHRHLSKSAQGKLQKALSDYLGRPVKLQIDIAEIEGITPAQAVSQQQEQRQNEAVAAIESDTHVQEIIDLFDASLVDTRPI